MLKKDKKHIVRVMIVTALIIGCIMGCGQTVKQENEVVESSVSVMTEEEEQEQEIVMRENVNQGMETLTAAELVKDMRMGWNLGNTLDCTRDDLIRVEAAFKFETAWGNPRTTQELIDAVIEQGFNVIRIPISWKNHIGEAPEYKIEESWMTRVKEVVDYAYNRGVYVILNTHHEDWNYPYYENEEAASIEMQAIWTQIAEVFADYDEHLIFEGQNEPRKVGTSVEWTGGDKEGWAVVNHLNQVFIDTVRQSGGSNPYRILMIPSYGANCWEGIKHVEVPGNDNRIIVSVHAYEPYDFALNPNGRSEWNQDTSAIDTIMGNLKTLFIDQGIPVIIGEFGAMNRDNEEERAQWAMYYVSKAKEIGIPCIWWDNGAFTGDGELLGLFDRRTYECVYPKVLEALQQATQE